MELKLGRRKAYPRARDLLIVPYGIETWDENGKEWDFKDLLIVPYGIETSSVSACTSDSRYLLIVPYGIETQLQHDG